MTKVEARGANGRVLVHLFPYLLLIALAFLADRLSKWWAAQFLAENGPTMLHPLLTLRETYNRGIAFGFFQGSAQVVGWLTILVILGLLIYLVQLPRRARLARFGLALMIGGSLGNLVDRLVAGEVLDFMQTLLRPSIFNVADIFINLGMILLVIGVIRQPSPGRPEQET